MTQTLLKPDEPILIDSLTWREFKAAEQLIDRPGVRLSFLDGVLEIRRSCKSIPPGSSKLMGFRYTDII